MTLALARSFIGQGIDVGVMKPISAGPQKDNDALYLKKALKLKDPLALINPVHLKLPLAPCVAAGLLGEKINLPAIFKAFKKLEKVHELLLVEGVGGALVPITENYFVADLVKDLNIPVIIVARAGLGTINHTLLTIEAFRARGVEIMGVVMNGYTGKALSEKTNAETISRIAKVPILGKIKWQKLRKN